MPIANQVKDFFHNEGIHSTTIQPEFIEDPPESQELGNCVLDCGEDKNCGAQRCCPEDVRKRKNAAENEKGEYGRVKSGSSSDELEETAQNTRV